MITVCVNGEETTLPERQSIRDLIVRLQVPAEAVAVEVNRHIVPRSSHTERLLEDGDVVEVVTFVGGG